MTSPRLPLSACLAAVTLLLAACETRPDRHAMNEEAHHSVPPMAADEPFFNGSVIAHLTLRGDVGGGGGPDSDSDKGGSHGGGGGGGRHGGGRSGGMGGGSGRGRSASSGDSTSSTDGSSASSMHRSAMPAAVLRLRLENTTPATLEVEVRDLDSALGDFAVRPDKLTIVTGESEEPDPMESLLGVDSYDLPVTVSLRLGGKTETKILTLHLVNPAPPTPPAPESPTTSPVAK